ncbi:MAG: hypothetical protein ABIH38_04925 [Patescibacteria group bacterium]
MGHPNLDPKLSMICDSQLKYRDMKLGQYIVITAEDAETGRPGKIRLRVLSIRKDKEDRLTVTFQYLGDNFTFWRPEARSKVKIKPETLMESGLSATLIPHFIMRMVGIGGIGSIRDYSFDCVGGQYDQEIICHNISGLETYFDEKEKFVPPDLTVHLAEIERTKAEYETRMAKDLPDKIVRPADEALLSKLQRKLEEYKGRLDPMKPMALQSSTYCKIMVLTQVLSWGEILPSIYREAVKDENWFSSESFRRACWLIEDYCRTGGENVDGGTGLK